MDGRNSDQSSTSKKTKQIKIDQSGMLSYEEESNKEMNDEVPPKAIVGYSGGSLTSYEKKNKFEARKERRYTKHEV